MKRDGSGGNSQRAGSECPKQQGEQHSDECEDGGTAREPAGILEIGLDTHPEEQQASRDLAYDSGQAPAPGHSSEMLCSPRSPSSTIRIFSSGANFLRVRRRISRTAASADCFFVLGILGLSSGSEDPAKCLLA